MLEKFFFTTGFDTFFQSVTNMYNMYKRDQLCTFMHSVYLIKQNHKEI